MRLLPASRSRGTAAALLVVGALVAGCGGDEAEDPQVVLDAAAEDFIRAETVHVAITSSELPESGNVLVGGEGDAERPNRFTGSMQVRVGGATADVEVLSSSGEFFAQLPFTEGLTPVDPAQFGFSDPGELVDPESGVGELLEQATALELQDAERVDGEVLDVVTGELPGQLVADLLTSADPAQPVQARFAIARETDELRTVELTGPFYEAETPTQYRVVLTDYDEPVEIPNVPDVASNGG